LRRGVCWGLRLWAQEMYERFCNVGMVVCFLCVWCVLGVGMGETANP